GGAPRPADALDAIGAFLHHAPHPHTDVRVEHRLHHPGTQIGVFLSVGVAEEIEAPHLVGTIRLAEPGSDAAVVDLGVQPLAVVDRGCDRTIGLAWGVLAMHAGDGGKAGALANDVCVHPQPMHVATHRDFIGSDDRDIVLSLAGHHAG